MIQIDCETHVGVEPALVIHVVASLDFGGVERHLEIIASTMGHAQMRHIFVALGAGGATESRLKALGANVLCLQQKVGIPSISAVCTLLKLFRRERPFVVHTHGAEANFHGLLAAWLASVPVRIGEEIGIPSHSRMAKRLFRLIYEAAHRVIGVSSVVTEWLVVNREVSSSKVVLVYNPVQLPGVSDSPVAPEDLFRIVFVGRLEAVKNSLALLEPVASLLDSGVPCELWVVGEGSERTELEQRIITMGLVGKVRLFGYHPDPATLIQQCHVFVQPSLSEGFGLAMVEAMGCGVPVITTIVGGAPDIIDHGENGWLLEEATPQLVTDALKAAWKLGPEKLRHMGLEAHKSVAGRFEPVNYINQIEALYLHVSAERRVMGA